jgi:hypothetical protein
MDDIDVFIEYKMSIGGLKPLTRQQVIDWAARRKVTVMELLAECIKDDAESFLASAEAAASGYKDSPYLEELKVKDPKAYAFLKYKFTGVETKGYFELDDDDDSESESSDTEPRG